MDPVSRARSISLPTSVAISPVSRGTMLRAMVNSSSGELIFNKFMIRSKLSATIVASPSRSERICEGCIPDSRARSSFDRLISDLRFLKTAPMRTHHSSSFISELVRAAISTSERDASRGSDIRSLLPIQTSLCLVLHRSQSSIGTLDAVSNRPTVTDRYSFLDSIQLPSEQTAPW